MPVAELSGEYQVYLSLDLTPVYEKLEDHKTLSITQPPADILDRRLAELKSKDAKTRLAAVQDLAYFPKEGDRVFSALAACLKDEDEQVRRGAFYSMSRYAEQIARHADVLIGVLQDENFDTSLRSYCTYLLGRYGPVTEGVEKALEEAAEAFKDDRNALSVKYALEQFQKRKKEKSGKPR